jgi:hypothetical protein
MIETYALTKEGSEFPIEMGSIEHVVWAWSELKYHTDPSSEYNIIRIKIETVKRFTQEDIEDTLDKMYEEDDNL